MDTEIRERVRQFIIVNFLFGDAARLPAKPESLLAAGIVDSTGLELVDFPETDLGVHVADGETVPDNLDSIDALTAFVSRKRSAVSAQETAEESA